MAKRTLKRQNPIAGLVVVISFGILLPGINIRLLLFVTGSLLQAAHMHKLLDLSVAHVEFRPPPILHLLRWPTP